MFPPALANYQSHAKYSEKLKSSQFSYRMKMHLSITVAWFVLAFLSLSKVTRQFSEVSTSVECPLYMVSMRCIYVHFFPQTKVNLN